MPEKGEGEIIKTNEIKLPDCIILEYSFDTDDRMLFIISSDLNGAELSDNYIRMNFFKIEN